MEKSDRPDRKSPRSGESQRPIPPAGPHAREDLTDHEKTPGTGSLPSSGKDESDVGPD